MPRTHLRRHSSLVVSREGCGLQAGKPVVALLSLTLGMTIECAACSSCCDFYSISRRQRILYLMHMCLINNSVL